MGASLSSNRPNPLLNPIIHEIQGLSPEQRRKVRHILFWALLVYLQFTWFGVAGMPLLLPAGLLVVATFFARTVVIGRRPTFVALHGAILCGMIISAVQGESWRLVGDFTALGALTVLELNHSRPGLLIAVAGEHVAGLAWNPWSSIVLMNNEELPFVGAAALWRIFAIIMIVALWFRVFGLPRFEPRVAPVPETKPSRPLTVAEWEARNPRK
jgi:hypothetical protein